LITTRLALGTRTVAELHRDLQRLSLMQNSDYWYGPDFHRLLGRGIAELNFATEVAAAMAILVFGCPP
jgi:hypothetical protein